MKYLLLTLITFSFMSFSQEEETRQWADGVIELTTVKVKTNFLGDYLDGIEKTWVAAAKIQEEMGIIDGYNVFVANDGSTVRLALYYPSWANKDPWSEEQQAEFREKFRATISEEDNTQLSQGYEDIREIVSVEMVTRIDFK